MWFRGEKKSKKKGKTLKMLKTGVWPSNSYDSILEQAAQGTGRVTIPGDIHEMCRCGAEGCGYYWTW